MKVNMTPNPLDVVTIHASQGDTEARQWEFELHNNGELIDTSDVTEQMFFKAYKGGTEQLLPENTSTPTTSPFLGDIKYPQGLLTDQEFLCRQSPTEEDGLAKITDIKGNTLVWNQLIQNGNFASSSGWNFPSTSNATTSISNNELSATYVASYPSVSQQVSIKKGHKFYLSFEFKASVNNNTPNGFFFYNSNNQSVLVTPLNYTTSYQKYEGILSYSDFDLAMIRIAYFEPSRWTAGDVISIKNVQLFDLTQMGLDITDPSDFTSLFPLSYYSYNQGSLLSFMGNGIKTVGKNMIDAVEQGAYSSTGSDVSGTTRLRTKFVSVQPNTTYSVKISGTVTFDVLVTEFSKNDLFAQYIYQSAWTQNQITFTTLSNCYYLRLMIKDHNNASTTLTPDMVTEIQLEKGTAPTSYEPYTSSTLSLPISTYFPNGMKSAGNVYDELTESKAITRVRMVDMGTLSFFYNSSSSFFTATIPDLVTGMTYATESPNVIVQNYEYKGGGVGWANMPNMSYGFNGQDMRIKNTAYTSSAEFVNAVRGTYMVYELATYEETSFTTASLVTENAEIPLSNNDGGLLGKCTEQLSENPGFIDAKIKLSDSDGECYSNKLQLHVERKPS